VVDGRPPPAESAGWIRLSRTSIILTADAGSINPKARGLVPMRLTGLITGNMMGFSFDPLLPGARTIVTEAEG
jgi:hypothetical protein